MTHPRGFGTIVQIEECEARKMQATLRRQAERQARATPVEDQVQTPGPARHHVEMERRKVLRAELRQVLEAPLVRAHGPRPLSVVDLSCDRLRPPRPAPADLVGRAPRNSKSDRRRTDTTGV